MSCSQIKCRQQEKEILPVEITCLIVGVEHMVSVHFSTKLECFTSSAELNTFHSQDGYRRVMVAGLSMRG